jgi:hypothetical protein
MAEKNASNGGKSKPSYHQLPFSTEKYGCSS